MTRFPASMLSLFSLRSLRTRVALLAVATSALTAAGLSALGYRTASSGFHERTESALGAQATLASTLADYWLRDRLHDLNALAATPEVRRILETVAAPSPEDQVAAEHALLAAQARTPAADSVALVEVSGRVFMSTSTADEGYDASKEPYLLEALAGREHIGDLTRAITSAGPALVVYVSAGVVGSNGTPIGAVRERLVLHALEKITSGARDQAGPGASGTLLDAAGGVVASTFPAAAPGEPAASLSPQLLQLVGKRVESTVSFQVAGSEQLGRLQPLQSARWIFVAGLPVAEVDRGARVFLWRAAISGLAGLLLATLSALLVSSRVVRSVEQLTDVTARIVSDGDYDHAIEVSGNDEVARLARSFEQMVAALRARTNSMLVSVRESEERFRVAFQIIPDAITISRLDDGLPVAVNQGFCRLSGWSEEEALGKAQSASGAWEDEVDRLRFLEELRRSQQVLDLEARFRSRSGTLITGLVSAKAFRLSGLDYFITITRDITERKSSERAQAAIYRIAEAASTEGTLQELLRRVHQVVAELMPAPNFYIALQEPGSHGLEFPYSADEQGEAPAPQTGQERGLIGYVLRNARPAVLGERAGFEALVQAGEVEPVARPPVSWVGVPLRTQDRVVGVLAAQINSGEARYTRRDMELLQFVSNQVARAIERKQGEQALRASERRFRALIEHNSDGICLLDADGLITYASPAVEQMLQLVPGEPPGNLVDHLLAADAPKVRSKLHEVAAQPGLKVLAEARAMRRDGSTLVLEGVFRNLLDDPAVRGIVLNVRDTSERKKMEAQLITADRMVSVGTLAAGVAHEINNPLAYVIANLEFLREALGKPGRDQDALDALDEAHQGAERVRVIVRDLKTFSRADDSKSGPTDVHRVLNASANMAWNEIRHRARMVKDYSLAPLYVSGTESRLGQVVLNLLVNAAQAIPEGRADENQIRLLTAQREGRVVIEVSDTGGGITEENRTRLFDPFFTTKPVGVGTGLGLYICRNIILGMGGELSVASTLGQGSTFRVSLPATSSSAPLEEVPVVAAPRRRARILIIDDEPLIISALLRALPEHDLVTESSAVPALQRLRSGERFDVVFCDVMMPVMTGIDFHVSLAAELPDEAARVVFLSGGAFTQSVRDYLEQVRNTKLDKPFKISVVRSLVEDRMHSAAFGA